jgi:hypothetical protein
LILIICNNDFNQLILFSTLRILLTSLITQQITTLQYGSVLGMSSIFKIKSDPDDDPLRVETYYALDIQPTCKYVICIIN